MRLGILEGSSGFFLIWAWLNYMDGQGVVPLAMAACALHELGHYGAIRRLGGDVQTVRLTAVGAEMVLARPLGYWQEGVAALAGPGVNFLLAVIFCSFSWGVTFAGLNLALGCFNMLPVGRLDGGRALRCTLALLLAPEWADRILAWTTAAVTFLTLAAGLMIVGLGGNLTLLVVALWLLAVFFNGKKKGNRACHMGRKRVK